MARETHVETLYLQGRGRREEEVSQVVSTTGQPQLTGGPRPSGDLFVHARALPNDDSHLHEDD